MYFGKTMLYTSCSPQVNGLTGSELSYHGAESLPWAADEENYCAENACPPRATLGTTSYVMVAALNTPITQHT